MSSCVKVSDWKIEPDEVSVILLGCAKDLLRLAAETEDEAVRDRRLDSAEDCIERVEARLFAARGWPLGLNVAQLPRA